MPSALIDGPAKGEFHCRFCGEVFEFAMFLPLPIEIAARIAYELAHAHRKCLYAPNFN